MHSQRRRITVAALLAALMMVLAIPSASANTKSVRLDISDGGWVGYVDVRATNQGNGSWRITGTVNKTTSKSGCLRVKSDQGAWVPGSATRVTQCSAGSKSFAYTTNRDKRLILEWTRSWKPDLRKTTNIW